MMPQYFNDRLITILFRKLFRTPYKNKQPAYWKYLTAQEQAYFKIVGYYVQLFRANFIVIFKKCLI